MAVKGLPSEARPLRSPDHRKLEEHALALVSALELAARRGGRPTFDCLFDRGFDRVYAWSYCLAERSPEHAQALTSEVLMSAARAVARRAVGHIGGERA